MLCWSGLRFSDIQRSKLSSWQIDSQTLRGLTWFHLRYAEVLYYVRHYMTLPWSFQQSQMPINASSYSIHGLKTTILSWAAQANLPESDRRLHGKHRPAQMSVQLYSPIGEIQKKCRFHGMAFLQFFGGIQSSVFG